ncbi:cystathionine beta-synthase [Cryomorphaceae bacterium 1068]|nr:cystathionine beta-synthase [Cryomorphaceae bacterium 1068]
MENSKVINQLRVVLKNLPNDWLGLTTHRLDIYNEAKAKTQFLDEFEDLLSNERVDATALNALPTAYDYIRLGHPLSCVLEWAIANLNHLNFENVIGFSSITAPVLAVLRKNLFEGENTRLAYTGELPGFFDAGLVRRVYGYQFELTQVAQEEDISQFDGTTIFLSQGGELGKFETNPNVDFRINVHSELGSILIVNGKKNESAISEIQHVRRRETIAMTPADCLTAIEMLIGESSDRNKNQVDSDKTKVLNSIQAITGAPTKPLVGSSGLSIQYAIMMGLIDDALEKHPGKAIKFIVPPNCYGGTNDQARRVAACLDNVEIVDLPVDGENDMVQSIHDVLDRVAKEDAVPYIIAEIPTNPRVEVPDLDQLKAALGSNRKTQNGEDAIDPVFILDQTFCPNFQFLGEGKILSTVRTISYASGSKFPSGGKCTAGYCVGNTKALALMGSIERHLELCDNEATDLQMEILAQQLPSMNQRITDAYENTREFVEFIKENLPSAKINFVSEELASEGFTPSVFSLDLPAEGRTHDEIEANKKVLNNRLIHMMITEIPNESKYCVSYGQLKGCYWTIPATSTQGTTKEGDKDYIVRASLSPDMDLERHKKVFLDFVATIQS